MPTYQYRCAKCGEQFEAWQSIHDDALTVHDGACGGNLAKVLGVGGIVLKGPGFYRNDSRSKSSGREGEPERKGKGESDSSKPDAAKSDTSSGNGSGDSKKSDTGSKSEIAKSGASKSDASKS